ncbi:alpha/beta fold hydrolase [Streptomyces torulosus]|uniref:alpha/beta fold hydrolase n=1 Tax=Streptomyces torulosus TaxID=68276 RepID=UPI0006EBB316|nr:alpha/beta fold hydrolase [Streptomyces torulosus]
MAMSPVRDELGVVFVHGFMSGPETWDTLGEFLAEDADLNEEVTPLRFKYATSLYKPNPMQSIPSFSTVAESLKEFLDTEAENFGRLVLVGHSQGGLIIQRYLTVMLSEQRGFDLQRIRRIVLFGCPNDGSEFGGILRKLLVRNNPQEHQLKPFDEEIKNTRRAVLRNVVYAAPEATASTCRIPFTVFAGESDGIVTPASAQSVFPEAAALPGDHFSILKSKQSYNSLKKRLREAILGDRPPPGTDYEPIKTTAAHDDAPALRWFGGSSFSAETDRLLIGAAPVRSPIQIAVEAEDAPLTEAEFPRTQRHLTVSLSTDVLDRVTAAAAAAEKADVPELVQVGRRIWEELVAAQSRLAGLIDRVRRAGICQPVAWCGRGELLDRLRTAIPLAYTGGDGADGFLAVGAGAPYFTPVDSDSRPRTLRQRSQHAQIRVQRAAARTTTTASADALLTDGRTSLADVVNGIRADKAATTRAVMSFTPEEIGADAVRETLDLLPFLTVGDPRLAHPELLDALEAAVRDHGDRLAAPSIVTGIRSLVAGRAAECGDAPLLRQALTWHCWSWAGLPLFAQAFGEVEPAVFPHLMDLRAISSGDRYYDRSVGEERYSATKLVWQKERFHLYLSGAGGTGKSCFLHHLYETIAGQTSRIAVWYRVDAPNSEWAAVQARIRGETVAAIREKLGEAAGLLLSEATDLGGFLHETVRGLRRSPHGIDEVVIFIDQLERTFESGDEPNSELLAQVSKNLVALLETVRADRGVRFFVASRKQYLPDFLGSSAKAARSRLEFQVLQAITDAGEQRYFVEKSVAWCREQELIRSDLTLPGDVAQYLVSKVKGHPLNTSLALIHLLSQDVGGELSTGDLDHHRPWEHLFDLDLVAAARDDLAWYFLLAMAHARTEIVRVEEVWWRLRLVNPKLTRRVHELGMTGVLEHLWMLGTLGRTVHVRAGGTRSAFAGRPRFVEFFHANLRDHLLRDVMVHGGADIRGFGRPGGTPATWRALDRLALYAHSWEHTQQLLSAEDVQALMEHREVVAESYAAAGRGRGDARDTRSAVDSTGHFELLFPRQDADARRALGRGAMECFVLSALVHDNLGRWAFTQMFPDQAERIKLCRAWLEDCPAGSREAVLRYLIELDGRAAHEFLTEMVLAESGPQTGSVRRAIADILAEPLSAARFRKKVLTGFLEIALSKVRGEPGRLPRTALELVVLACNHDRGELVLTLSHSAELLKTSDYWYVQEHADELVAPDLVDAWLAAVSTDGIVPSRAMAAHGGRAATALGLVLGKDLAAEVSPAKMAAWSKQLRERIGTPLPDLSLVPGECERDEAELRIRGQRVSRGLFPPGHVQLARRRWEQLAHEGLPEPRPGSDDGADRALVWLPAEQARELGATMAKDNEATLLDWLEEHCRSNFDRLFDRGLAMELVDELQGTTTNSRGHRFEVNGSLVRQIMVNLVEEGVRLDSGRDGLLTELWKLNGLGRGRDPADFLAPIRVFLRADVSRSALGDSTRLTVITLERQLQDRLNNQVRQRGGPSLLADPTQTRRLVQAVSRVATAALRDDDRSYPVLITSAPLRYPLARLLLPVDRRLRVLSPLELQEGTTRVLGGSVTLTVTE